MGKPLEGQDKWPPMIFSGDTFDKTVTCIKARARDHQEGSVSNQHLFYYSLQWGTNKIHIYNRYIYKTLS